jgi:predicted AlkP superfamily phosphohydrolase/phosphomutase
MNVPITFPAQSVNGFMVSGFPAPDGLPEVVWPREEYVKMKRKFPEFTVNWIGLGVQASTDSKKVSLIESTNAWLRARIRTFEYFLDRHEVDFCFLVYEYTDKVQHWFYPLLDSLTNTLLAHEDSKALSLLQEGYQEVDAAVARLVERFGQNANYIVVSDHGFGPVGRVLYLNHLLEQHGLFAPRRIKALAAKAASVGRLPLRIRSKLGLAQDEPWHRLDTWRSPLTDFFHTRAFAGHPYEQAVYINVVGRCPHGIVGQGSEYEAIRSKVVDVLQQTKDPKTGEPIFEGVWACEEIYTGKYVQNSPDVIFDLAPGYVVSAGIGLSAVLDGGFLRDARKSDGTGFHRPDGIFIGYGPAFRSTQAVKATLLDVAPTVLALMGVAPSVEMDGRIIEEAIWSHVLSSDDKVTKISKPVLERPSGSVYSLDDEAEIARRLADLGYL